MDLTFANAWMLFFCWMAPAMAVWWHWVERRRLRGIAAFMAPAMQRKLTPSLSSIRPRVQMILTIAGIFLMLIAAARPQWGTAEVRVFQKSRDLMILLDVSRSMLADDVHPNRLQRAKIDLMDLIKDLRGDRAGLIAFRYKAAMLCPLTTDYAFLRQALDGVSIDSAPAGETNIGDAIQKALEAMESDQGSHRAMILISDGEDLSGKAVELAQEAGKKNIPIFTVGLGSAQGSRIPERIGNDAFLKYKGEDVTTKLDNQTLMAVAEATRGAHISIGTASTASTSLGTLYRNLRQRITAEEQQEASQKRRIDRYQFFLLPALLLLLAATFLSRGRLAIQAPPQRPTPPPVPTQTGSGMKPPPGIRAAVVGALLVALSTGRVIAQPPEAPEAPSNPPPATASPTHSTSNSTGRASAAQAQRLFRSGKYTAAAELYLKAAGRAAGRSRHDLTYNAAVAYYRAGLHEKACDVLRQLYLSEPERNPETSRSLGTALFKAAEAAKQAGGDTNTIARARLLREAGEAFRDSSRATEDTARPIHNLAVVLDQLPEADEQANIARLMAQYGNTPAPQLSGQMLTDQRRIIEDMAAAFTNNNPGQVYQFEDLARREKANTQLWIPLKGKILQALAQEAAQKPDAQKQMATLNAAIEGARERMTSVVRSLKDLDTSAMDSALAGEAATYQFWKGMAPFPTILQEDMQLQTNAISRLASKNSSLPPPLRPEQEEALALTHLFSERLAAQVPEGGDTPRNLVPGQTPDPTADTNAAAAQPGAISAETRKQILLLADNAALAQQSALDALKNSKIEEAIAEQNRGYNILKEIEKLLPKDKQNQPQQKPEQQPDPPPDQPPPQPQEKKEDKPKEEQPPEDVRKMMEKALQREKDHEQEKQRQRAIHPMSPHEKDW